MAARFAEELGQWGFLERYQWRPRGEQECIRVPHCAAENVGAVEGVGGGAEAGMGAGAGAGVAAGTGV